MDKKKILSADLIGLNKNVDINNGCVVAVGSFDGVHLGHRAMLDAVVKEAKRLGVPSAVFTFHSEDNPKSSKLLAMPEKKLQLLKEAGAEIVVSAPFSALRNMEAENFAKDYLLNGMGAKSIVCGYDFRFGKDRKGDSELIKTLLSPKGVDVITPSVFYFGNEPVSSTNIRNLINSGEVEKANNLLGRAFSFCGEAVHGAKLGRTLGFPTVNQEYPFQLMLLKFGVYAVECELDGKVYQGVANVGVKPTVSKDSSPLCETHLFGFSGDCYKKNIETRFLKFIREEKRFSSVEELKDQIQRDKSKTLEYFEKEYSL